MHQRVGAIDARATAAAGRQAAWRASRWGVFRRARVVMAFLSTPDEIDTEPLLATALADAKIVVVPRVVPGPARLLEVVRFKSLEDPTVPGAFGIRQPVDGEVLDPASVELVFVPGLAFDLCGGRLGHGGGYYDRFLVGPAAGAVHCGLGFDVQLTDAVPQDEHDVAMQHLLTDARLCPIPR
jgi:5-formyltetrahydrofolate cyclo-ligase